MHSRNLRGMACPALENMPKVKDDNELLKGLPKVKAECTWIPWTYDRLTFRSGYGAGIDSPDGIITCGIIRKMTAPGGSAV